MRDSLCVATFGLNQLISSIFHYSKYFYRYNFDTNQFHYNQNTKDVLTLYNVFNLFVCGILWPATFFYIIIIKGIFNSKSIKTDELFYTVVLFTPFMLCVGLNYTNYKYRHVTCEYVNDLLSLRLYYNRELPNKQQRLSFKHFFGLLKQGKNLHAV